MSEACRLEPGRQRGAEGARVRRSGTPSSRPQREARESGERVTQPDPGPLRSALATEPTPQAPEHGEVAQIGSGLRLFGRFQNLWNAGKAPVVQQQAERREAEQSPADVLVAIEARAERRLRVVQMEGEHPAATDRRLALRHGAAIARRRAEIVSGHEQMTGVEADAE